MNLINEDGYLEIELNNYEELIFNNRNIILWTNGYDERLNMTVEELDNLIEKLIEFRKGRGNSYNKFIKI